MIVVYFSSASKIDSYVHFFFLSENIMEPMILTSVQESKPANRKLKSGMKGGKIPCYIIYVHVHVHNMPRHDKTCFSPMRTKTMKLVSVAEQAGLSLTWSQTPKTDFLVTRL